MLREGRHLLLYQYTVVPGASCSRVGTADCVALQSRLRLVLFDSFVYSAVSLVICIELSKCVCVL